MIFKILPHPADLKIEIEADSLAEFFEEAVKGMYQGAGAKYQENGFGKIENISLKAKSPEQLLVDFLNEIWFLSQKNQEVYLKFEWQKINPGELSVRISGKPLKEFETEIKGTTFYNLKIVQQGNKWQTVIVFDI